MAKRKVLIFHPALTAYRIDLFNRLAAVVELFVVFFNDRVVYQKELDNENVRKRLTCPYAYLLKGCHVCKRDFRVGIGRIINRFLPDVVISHEFSYVTLFIMLHRAWFAKKDYAHLLWTAENIHLLKKRGPFRQVLRKICLRSVDGLLVYSDEVAQCFAKQFKIPQEKIFICANHQAESSFFEKLKDARGLMAECITRYDLAEKKVVLYVGRLVKRKNLTVLIEAFARTVLKEPHTILVLVGGGPEKKTLETSAVKRGVMQNIRFIGHCEGSALYVWYLLASLFVLPGKREPYGAVVNEALLSGIKVLCSSHAGARVLIREGKNGHLFDPYNSTMLFCLLRKSLLDAVPCQALTNSIRRSIMLIPFEHHIKSFVKAVEHAARNNDQKINKYE